MKLRTSRLAAGIGTAAALALTTFAAAEPAHALLVTGCNGSTTYTWCEELDATGSGITAYIRVYRGSDGHDHIDTWGYDVTKPGVDLWVLTWNGSGWNWKGYPMNTPNSTYETDYWYTSVSDIWDGNGTQVKIAVWDYNGYIYSDAH